jgi:hypothetical protein
LSTKAKKILHVDYSGAKNNNDLISVLQQEVEIERKLEGKTLCLVDVTNAHAGKSYMAELKKLGKEVRSIKVEKTATLGVTGIKKILFEAYVRFTGEAKKLSVARRKQKNGLLNKRSVLPSLIFPSVIK